LPALRSDPDKSGIWEIRIAPFLRRYSVALAAIAMLIASARIVSTYSALTVVDDEPGHFACGLEWLSKHVYRYEAQHPPLQRVLDAVGPYLAGVRPIGGPDRNEEGAAVIARSGNVDRTVFLMRLGVLPCFWIACAVVYLWARRYWDGAVAVIAVACLTLSPPVLAHAGLATTDISLAAFLPAAFLALLVWAESPTLGKSLLVGFACALAVLSKFTALAYLPASVLLALVLFLLGRRPSRKELVLIVRTHGKGLVIAVLTGAVTVWAAYWFSFGEVSGWHVRLAAPEFFQGILDAMHHAKQGHDADAYLLGETNPDGFWYFFFAALAFKTPLALLAVMVVGIAMCIGMLNKVGPSSLVAFTFGILLATIPGRLNIGVRHVLPVYVSLSIAAALGVHWMLSRYKLFGVCAAGALFLWATISGARAHPDYLAYFNEIADREPERYLVESDLYWGQGKKLLAARLRSLGVKEIAVKEDLHPLFHQRLYPEFPHIPIDPDHAQPGWAVISANDRVLIKHSEIQHSGTDEIVLRDTVNGIAVATQHPEGTRRPWYESAEPKERVSGYLLFYTPPGAAAH